MDQYSYGKVYGVCGSGGKNNFLCLCNFYSADQTNIVISHWFDINEYKGKTPNIKNDGAILKYLKTA